MRSHHNKVTLLFVFVVDTVLLNVHVFDLFCARRVPLERFHGHRCWRKGKNKVTRRSPYFLLCKELHVVSIPGRGGDAGGEGNA